MRELTYSVTFDAQGGTDTSTVTVASGNKVPQPDEPTRNGHVFEGWFLDAEGTQSWDFNTDMVEADLTLYAKWTVARYTITFDARGGSPGSEHADGTVWRSCQRAGPADKGELHVRRLVCRRRRRGRSLEFRRRCGVKQPDAVREMGRRHSRVSGRSCRRSGSGARQREPDNAPGVHGHARSSTR